MDSDITIVEQFAELDPARVANLPQASPITIRSIAIALKSESETLIYIGTGGGKLILFSINPSLPDSAQFVQLISIGNRLIESILVLSEIEGVLVLSDGFLYLSDWFLSKSVKKLGFLKEVTSVARRFHTEDVISNSDIHVSNSCFVVAAMGKKLISIEMILTDNNIKVHLKEMLGVEGVKSLAWINESIFVGNSNGYFLFSSETGKNSEIFSLPESSRSTKLRPLSNGTEMLLLMDNLGVVVDLFGQPRGNSLVFKCLPDFVCELGSYVVVSGDAKLEMYRRRNGECLQSVDLGQFGNFTSSNLFLSGDELGKGQIVLVATTRKVICFRKASMEEQIKALLRKKKYEAAVSLSQGLMSDGEITKNTLSFVHAQVGFLLFFDLRFKEAVDHFLLSENMEPSEIFPFIMRDPNRWSELVPRNRYWGLHPPPVPLEEVIDEGLIGIQRAIFLKKAGVDAILDEGFLYNPPSRAALLELAITNIIRYLVAARDKGLSPQIKEGVDTLLMYLYRALDLVSDMENLASSENSCVVEELEGLLDESGHLRTLAFLYGSKQMASKSLAIWRLLAKNYTTGLWRENSEQGVSSERIAAQEASKLLELSSDQDLVLEHFGWISDIDEDLAVAILISEKRTNQLSPDNVLGAIDVGNVVIRQRYLQWLIEDQVCEDPRYHTLYALSLATSALESLSTGTDSSQCLDKVNGELEDSNGYSYSIRGRLQSFLQVSDLYDPEEVLYVIEDSELWLEKAILYRKMGQENIVLQILALKLEDSEAAEQYCAEIGRDEAYIQLLDLYLDPQNGKEPMFTAAVRLLHNHGESLDPLQVLEKLSPEMPLQLASDTILRMLRARVHHHRQGQIVHNISRAINLDARLARMEERSRHVQLTDETVCDSCNTLLGTKLFVMYPDDSVVCYRCYRNQGESSNGRNFKRDVNFRLGWLVTR